MKNIGAVTDKDFDKVFHEKLYSMEIEPADSVWAGISGQLDTTRKKRSFPVLWLAAASMTAVIGVGIWFSSQKEPMKLTGTAGADVGEKNIQVVPKLVLSTGSDIKKTSSVKERIALLEIPKDILKRKKNERTKARLSDAVVVAQAPSFKEDEPAVNLEDSSSKTEISTKVAAKETQVLALAEPESATEEPQVKEKKIRSVGSLVNFVVSKVDKRKNKIIEFEDGDEGTMVSGLNLGLLKFQAKQ